jgi:acetyltransferase
MHRETWTAANGGRYTLRPLQAPDAELLAGLLNGSLAGRSRYQRFHGTLGRLSAQRLQQLADADFVHHHAWVVTLDDADGTQAVAEGRFHVSADGRQAEFALATADRWQRQGIATRLMRCMLAAARSLGLQGLRGEVLCHNEALFALMRRCDLACRPHPQEPGLVVAESRWQPAPASSAVGPIRPESRAAHRAFDRCVGRLIGLRLALAGALSH